MTAPWHGGTLTLTANEWNKLGGGRFGSTLTETWNVRQRVSGTKSETWETRQRVSGSLSETWGDLQHVSGSLSETWTTIARVSGTLIETWDVHLVRVSSSLTETWDVAEAPFGASWDNAVPLTLGTPTTPLPLSGLVTFHESSIPGTPSAGYTPGWYTFTPSVRGEVVFDTFSTVNTDPDNVDTILALYEGTSYATRIELAYNDDAEGGTVLSRLAIVVQAGVTYHLLVTTFNVDPGSITAYVVNSTLPTFAPYSDPEIIDDTTETDAPDDHYYGDFRATGCKVAEDVGLFLWSNSDEPQVYWGRAARWELTSDGPGMTLGAVAAGPLEMDLSHDGTITIGPTDTGFREISLMYGVGNGWAVVFFGSPNYSVSSFGQLIHVDPITLEVTFGDLIDGPDFTRSPTGNVNQNAYVGNGRVLFTGEYGGAGGGTTFLSVNTTVDPPTYDLAFVTNAADTLLGDIAAWVDMGTQWMAVYRDATLSPLVHISTFPDLDGHPDITVAETARVTPFFVAAWDVADTYAGPLFDDGRAHVWASGFTSGPGVILSIDTATWTVVTHAPAAVDGGLPKNSQWGGPTWLSFLPMGQTMLMGFASFVSPSFTDDGGAMALWDGGAEQQRQTIMPYDLWLDGIYNWEVIPVSDLGHLLAITVTDDTARFNFVAPMLVAAEITPVDAGGEATGGGDSGMKLQELMRGALW